GAGRGVMAREEIAAMPSDPLVTVPISVLPPGTAFSRLIQALGAARGDVAKAHAIAAAWRDTPQVAATLTDAAFITKASVPPATTTDATWAGPLAPYGIAAEALTILRGLSILGALEPTLTRIPLQTRVPHETGTGLTGGWVGEGRPVPAQPTAFATVLQAYFKFGVIVPLAQELLEFSRPDALTTIRRTVLGGLARSLDQQFLLPTVPAAAGAT